MLFYKNKQTWIGNMTVIILGLLLFYAFPVKIYMYMIFDDSEEGKHFFILIEQVNLYNLTHYLITDYGY